MATKQKRARVEMKRKGDSRQEQIAIERRARRVVRDLMILSKWTGGDSFACKLDLTVNDRRVIYTHGGKVPEEAREVTNANFDEVVYNKVPRGAHGIFEKSTRRGAKRSTRAAAAKVEAPREQVLPKLPPPALEKRSALDGYIFDQLKKCGAI